MANTSNENLIVAYFPNHADAENAIEDLQDAGFRSDQIGSSYEDYEMDAEGTDDSRHTDHRSFWQKVRDFFSGESEDNREQRTGEESSWYDRGYTVPEQYRDRLSAGGGLISVRTDSRITEAEEILTSNNGQIDREFATEWRQQPTGTQAQGTGMESSMQTEGAGTQKESRRIQLLSEVLRVQKERVRREEVKLRKEVRTETQNVQVPVTREEIVIERTPVTGERPATGSIGTDKEVRVPLSEERVRVEKVPVVREEVRVGKKPVSETQNVSDQVRREELEVEGADETTREKTDKRKTA